MSNMMNVTLPARKDVPADDKWHIEDIFASNEAFFSTLSDFKEELEKLSAFQGHLGDSAETLYEYLSKKEDILIKMDSLYSYAYHRSDEDTSDPYYQDLKGQIEFAVNHFYEIIAFEDPELLSLPESFIGCTE